MILFITLSAVFMESFQQVSQEKTVKKYGYKVHMAIKFALMTCMLLSFEIIKLLGVSNTNSWISPNINFFGVSELILNLLLVIFSTILFNKILQTSSAFILNIILKLNILVVILIEMVRKEVIVSASLLIGIIIFLIGIYAIIYNGQKLKEEKKLIGNILGIIILLIIILAIPYIEQDLIRKQLLSKEFLVILESICPCLYALLILRPKIDNITEVTKSYFLQSLLAVIGSVLFKILVQESILMYTIATMLIMTCITILSRLMLKTKVTKLQYAGVLFSIIGYYLISIN